ncbi:MAG: mechanosensitive ion channel family protein [Saprospiraceae bacterium]|nr:mechanosensitive ion channel family protein [Saprospiraceae bacterium]
MDSIEFGKYYQELTDWAIIFVPKLILAVLILYFGMKIVKKLSKVFSTILKRAKIDIEVEEFLVSLIDIILKIIVFLISASIVGFEFSTLFGILAAAGFAVGLALQGFMGNFASGLTIIFFKPYKVGDWVQISGTFGRVKSIEIFSTNLVTPGDKTLIIPNGKVTDDIITNYSTRGKIRVELQVTMPYEESFPRVKEVIMNALVQSELILQEPKPVVGIESYDSHNIVVAIRPYILPDNYWEATFEVYALVKQAFKDNHIKVAYSEGVELGPIGE